LEYKLEQWKFKKKINKKTWSFIDHRISKRKRYGRDSEVIADTGRRVKASRVEKETKRYRDISIFPRLLRVGCPQPSCIYTESY